MNEYMIIYSNGECISRTASDLDGLFYNLSTCEKEDVIAIIRNNIK